MKQLKGLTFVGYVVGVIFTVTSYVQYAVLYPDTDRLIAYLSLGILILAVSWLFNRQSSDDARLYALEEYLAGKKLANKK